MSLCWNPPRPEEIISPPSRMRQFQLPTSATTKSATASTTPERIRARTATAWCSSERHYRNYWWLYVVLVECNFCEALLEKVPALSFKLLARVGNGFDSSRSVWLWSLTHRRVIKVPSFTGTTTTKFKARVRLWRKHKKPSRLSPKASRK